jgi:hypothetical protein
MNIGPSVPQRRCRSRPPQALRWTNDPVERATPGGLFLVVEVEDPTTDDLVNLVT